MLQVHTEPLYGHMEWPYSGDDWTIEENVERGI